MEATGSVVCLESVSVTNECSAFEASKGFATARAKSSDAGCLWSSSGEDESSRGGDCFGRPRQVKLCPLQVLRPIHRTSSPQREHCSGSGSPWAPSGSGSSSSPGVSPPGGGSPGEAGMTEVFSASRSGPTEDTWRAKMRVGVSGAVEKLLSGWGTSVGAGAGTTGGNPARPLGGPGAEAGWWGASDGGASVLLDESRREDLLAPVCSGAEDLDRSRSLERAALPDWLAVGSPMTATTRSLLPSPGHRDSWKAFARIGCLSSILVRLGGGELSSPSLSGPGGAMSETGLSHVPPGGLFGDSPKPGVFEARSPKEGMKP